MPSHAMQRAAPNDLHLLAAVVDRLEAAGAGVLVLGAGRRSWLGYRDLARMAISIFCCPLHPLSPSIGF